MGKVTANAMTLKFNGEPADIHDSQGNLHLTESRRAPMIEDAKSATR
jgi:hypothetical protein